MNSKRYLVALIALCMPMAANAQSAKDSPKQSVSKLVSRVSGALARLEYTIDREIIPPRPRSGQCVCIDASKNLFMTRDIPSGIPAGELKDFVLITPGVGGKKIKAAFVGVDPKTGLSFIRAEKGHKFSEVRFARASELRLGYRVISVGLLGPQMGNVPYLGTGMVSSVIRLPQHLVYISGGELTNSSSPVFTDDGRAVGIVASQLPIEYRLMLGGKWTNVGLSGRQTGRFFMPVEEFIGALSDPASVKKLPWTGVVSFYPVGGELAETIKNLGGVTAAMVGQVIPDSPAAKAGIKQGDTIVAFEGVPLEKMATPEFTVAEFTRRLFHRKVGSRISLTILRKGKRETVQVELAAMPTSPHEATHYYNKPLGIAARDLVLWDRHVGRDKPLQKDGVIVTMIRRDSPAALGKLSPGDIITAINDRSVKSAESVGSILDALTKAGSTKSINFIVRRGDKPEAVVVNPKP